MGIQNSDIRRVFRQSYGNAVPDILPVLSQTVTLTNAEIKALPTSGFELPVTPESGKMLIFLNAVIHTHLTAAYTNISAGAKLLFDVGGRQVSQYMERDCLVWILDSGDYFAQMHPLQWLNVTSEQTITPTFPNLNSMIGQTMWLGAVNSGGDFTGGNEANEMKVTAIFTIAEV